MPKQEEVFLRVAKVPTAWRASADVKKPQVAYPALLHLDSVPNTWSVGDRLVIQGEDFRLLSLDRWAGKVEVEPWQHKTR